MLKVTSILLCLIIQFSVETMSIILPVMFNTADSEDVDSAKYVISIITWTLLGLITMLLIVTFTLLIFFIRKTKKLKMKVEQYAKSYSRYTRICY